MPALAGSWVRTVDWMAPEGEVIGEGELVVQINPGVLIENEETHKVALEEEQLRAEAQSAQNSLAVIDAETQLAQAKSMRQLAWLDAQIPESAVTQLNYERAQLALENAENALQLSRVALANAKTKQKEQIPVGKRLINQADQTWQRTQEALQKISIRAQREGYVIYGENPMTRSKIFPGAAVPPGTVIATIADRSDLQFVFWVHDADIHSIQASDRLTVIPDALPDIEVEAQINLISNHAVERETWSQGGYFKVTARPLSDIPDELLPGMAIFGKREE